MNPVNECTLSFVACKLPQRFLSGDFTRVSGDDITLRTQCVILSRLTPPLVVDVARFLNSAKKSIHLRVFSP